MYILKTKHPPSLKLRRTRKKNGRLITSHRSTTYSCCLPALGGFSRSWSCKTCRRKDKEATVFGNCENGMYIFLKVSRGIQPGTKAKMCTHDGQKRVTNNLDCGREGPKNQRKDPFVSEYETSDYLVKSEFKYAIPINSSALPPKGRK